MGIKFQNLTAIAFPVPLVVFMEAFIFCTTQVPKHIHGSEKSELLIVLQSILFHSIYDEGTVCCWMCVLEYTPAYLNAPLEGL